MMTSQGLAPTGAHAPSNLAGQGRYGQSKWQLLKVIEDIREPLGLKGTSIAVLRAMVSLIKGDQVNHTREDGHICFASNATLAKRAHVSIQTVERHIAKLVKLGLLNRHSSANGKRWARRDRHGVIVMASGLSLAPLAARYAEFVRMSQALADAQTELRILRDKCAAACADLKARLTDCEIAQNLLAQAHRLLRRRPQKDALIALLQDITAQKSQCSDPEPDELRGADHKNEGHKETDLSQSVKEGEIPQIQVSPAQLEHAYPRLCAELRPARSQDQCDRIMSDIAQQLRLGDIWFDAQSMGPAMSFMVMGYILERIETVQSPQAYVTTLLKQLRTQKIAWKTLLKRPKKNLYLV